MSGRRISAPVALLGMLAVAAAMAATVVGLHALVNPGQQVAPLEAPIPADEGCDAGPLGAQVPRRVTAAQLIECPEVFDGARVRYRGEVVRAILHRRGRAVVQVNDDRYGLELGPLPEHRTAVGGNSGTAVVLSEHDADDIAHVGDYRHRGDVLDIAGTFRAADPFDGGGPTITADTVVIQRPGQVLEHRVDPLRLVVAAVLAVGVLGLAAANRFSPRR